MTRERSTDVNDTVTTHIAALGSRTLIYFTKLGRT